MEGEHVRDRVSSPGLPVPGAPVGTDPIDSSGIFELCGWEVLEVSAAATTDAVPRIHGALRRRNQRRSFLEPATGTTFRGAREPQLEPEEGLTESAADMTEEPLALALHFGVSMHSDSWRLEMLAKNGKATNFGIFHFFITQPLITLAVLETLGMPERKPSGGLAGFVTAALSGAAVVV